MLNCSGDTLCQQISGLYVQDSHWCDLSRTPNFIYAT
jgi:hypothetical protein